MNRSLLGILLATSALITSCNGSDGGTTTQRPFRDSCQTVIDQPFPFLEADGETVRIGSLTVGGTETSGNFANRGDIVVKYADTNRITVEMCRFTMAANEDLAQADFDKLEAWAYDATGSPKRPKDMDAEDNCIDPEGQKPWRNDCRIRTWYDGQSQIARAGADFKVTIPRGYIYDLEITTEDNDEDTDYQNRGDVCVEGLPGSVDISLGSGSAYIIMAADANPMPECPTADRQTCESNGWDPDLCPCLANMFSFSQTKVASQDAFAADITVDLPQTSPAFWANVSLTNEGQQTKGAAPVCADDNAALGARCDACVDPSVGSFEIDSSLGSDAVRDPWRNLGAVNYPGQPATRGAGYSVQLTSNTCQAVSNTESPDDFAGAGNGSEQNIEERGNITVCSDCIRNAGCDALVKI